MNHRIPFTKHCRTGRCAPAPALLALASVLFVIAIPARGNFDSAVVHLGVNDTGSSGIDNVVNFLLGDARFDTITNHDADMAGIPTLGQLSAYDSVLVVTDNLIGTLTGGGLGTDLGNVLDDYVGAGGRVVLSAFAGNTDIGIDGDILALAPHTLLGVNVAAGTLNMATAVTSHFVFHGVTSFASNFASDIGLSPVGVQLAAYNSGTPGVLTVADDSVMFVNGFPGNEANYQNGSDFGLVFANALAPIPEPSTLLLGLAAMGGAALVRRPRSSDI